MSNCSPNDYGAPGDLVQRPEPLLPERLDLGHRRVAGLSDDPVRFAYLAEGNAKQARKRVAADVLILDRASRVLLVDPTYTRTTGICPAA